MLSNLAVNGRELSARFNVWLCDIWGVVHNGEAAHPAACDVLAKHRENGGIIILITNAPRPSHAIVDQLDGLKVPRNCYDAIVASGDVTRELVTAFAGQKVFFLGPDRDRVLKNGLAVEWTELAQADAVLCSGLVDDRSEQPGDYDEILQEMREKNLTMICANPDIVVQFGDRLLPCAGALARNYQELGGKVQMAGKPHAAIYDVSINRASDILGKTINRSDVLALGDGMKTDITGARDNNLAVAFITGGIHDAEIGSDGSTEDMANIARTAVNGVNVAGAMRKLEW